MDLWNEYEGRSIDGLFPLERLIRPEGRSAFFSTTSSAGTSTVIRLIESHFDEDEILARWTSVSDLHQPNLLTLIRFGQAMMDETSLVYVVMEPTEADLGQILCERPLTVAETRQIAASLIPAIQALHARGFIHEHIQPANVLAVGEVVKLRSDCIREAPDGAEGDALRFRDVRDLATLLLHALTQQRSDTVSPTSPPLPVPFREIIHNGIAGTWGLAQMAAALEAATPSTPRPPAAISSDPMPAESTIQELPIIPARTAEASPQSVPASSSDARTRPLQKPVAVPAAHRPSESTEGRIRVPLRQSVASTQHWLVLLAVAVLGLMLFAAYTLLRRHSTPATVTTQPLVPAIGQPLMPSPDTTAQATANAAPTALKARDSWRVIAYTYNRQDQAAAKAHTLEQRFSELHPVVFTPTGRAPFLVTLGGLLTREAAFALRDKLRRDGLPRDLYAQNYTTKSR